jgi:F-type H+-transporting ATPase subunit a
VRRKSKKIEESIAPPPKVTTYNIFELITQSLHTLLKDILKDDAEKYLPLVGSLFVYILSCNLIGLIPGFKSPTDNINTNLGCSIIVFIYYNYVGIREVGWKKYLRNFMGPVLWLAPLILVVELVSHIVRPISLSVRLYGNIAGDHIVLGMFSNIAPFVVPVLFMLLAVFISFIQAFVFSLLSTIYIALATNKEH